MRLLYNKFFFYFLLVSQLIAQFHTPDRYLLKSTVADTFIFEGLSSNIVAEIRLMGDSLTWLGTGQGLALHDGHRVYTHRSTSESLSNDQQTNLLPQGGIPAIAVKGDTLAVAFSGDNGTIQVGYGLTITKNASQIQDSSGILWSYLPQPTDFESDTVKPFGEGFFRILPVTVPEANVTYDACIDNGFLWIASWAGGLRRYNINNGSWEIVPMPMDAQDSLSTCTGFIDIDGRPIMPGYYLNPRDPGDGGNHNHKAFSVLAYKDTVWVGTANGINRGVMVNEIIQQGENQVDILDCIEWVHYTYENGLSGNFVVGLSRQVWNNQTIIWAATMNADNAGEVRGLSYTRDGGLTWNKTLLGQRIYNVFAKDSLILASSQSGLWKSLDGENWALFDPAIDTTFLSISQVLTNVVYTSVWDQRDSSNNFWIGTPDGLAFSSDVHGASWTIYQAEYDSIEFYAYPNPFSPYNHNQLGNEGYVRFHTGNVSPNQIIELDIFNFAMEKVYHKDFNLSNYIGALKWDGRGLNGKLVDNGVYFIRMKYSPFNKSPQDYWDKLILVK